MNKKIVCLSLAGMMLAQNVAYAQVDRTAEVTDQAIAQAQQNIASLRVNLQQLDDSLLATAKQIELRDHSGGIMNGFTVAGAAVGLGITALGFMTLTKGAEGSGLGAVITFAGSVVMNLASIVTGTASGLLKKDVETGKMDQELDRLQKNITANMQGADKQTSAILVQLSSSVAGMRKSLKEYQKDESSTSRMKLGSHIAQGVGAALLFYGMTDRSNNMNRNSRAFMVGMILMNAGSVARVISGLSDSQADLVMSEIKATRLSIQTAISGLE